ncbi:MAG: YfbR-like 5'-deoxynucleotidase [Nanobdellota archaeon]
MDTSNIFRGFDGREEALSGIKRFRKIDVMFYRTDDLIHSYRTALMRYHLSPHISSVFPEVDNNKGFYAALAHDDHEMIDGDIPHSSKRSMSRIEKNIHDMEELKSIKELSEIYPEQLDGSGYKYEELQMMGFEKDDISSQINSFIDKVDGFCEAYHEFLAGNNAFMEPVRHYPGTINGLFERFPLLQRLEDNPFFSRIPEINMTRALENSRSHTNESIKENSGLYQYDLWKSITERYFGSHELTRKREDYSLPKIELPVFHREEMYSE